MLSVGQTAAEIALHEAGDPQHGYSQPNRAGIGTGGGVGEWVTVSDGRSYGISPGDRDCASLAIECYAAQGVDCGGAWYTLDMREKMLASGNFMALPASTWRNPEPGDILLTERNRHAAVAVGGGRLVEALRSESHSTHGALGDQDGGEIWVRDLYDDGWTCVLRYVGPERDQASDEPAAEPAEEEEDMPTECVINVPQADDMACNFMVYVCGDRVHDIANPEALKYLNEVYRACHGRDIPCFEMSGSREFGAFQRFLQAIRGGIPSPEHYPAVDMFEPRSGERSDGCRGTE